MLRVGAEAAAGRATGRATSGGGGAADLLFWVVAGDRALGFKLGGALGDAFGFSLFSFFCRNYFALAWVEFPCGTGGRGGLGCFALVGACAGLAVFFAQAFWGFLWCHVCCLLSDASVPGGATLFGPKVLIQLSLCLDLPAKILKTKRLMVKY